MKRFIISVFAIVPLTLLAQDPEFHFNDATSVYFNPAFAGVEGCPKFSATYSRFRPGIENNYTTLFLNYQQYIKKLGGGLGLTVISDKGEVSKTSFTEVSGIYNYEVNPEAKIKVRLGIQGGFIEGRAEHYNMGNRFDPKHDGVLIQVIEPLTIRKFNLTTGMLAYSSDFYFGLSAGSVNAPNECVECDRYENDKTPVKLTSVLGTYIDLDERKKKFLIPSVNFIHQNPRYTEPTSGISDLSAVNNLSFQLNYKHNNIIAGLGYRYRFDFPSTYLGHVGWEGKKLIAYYTYDHTSFYKESLDGIEELTRTGAHQLSVIIPFDCKEGKVTLCNCFD